MENTEKEFTIKAKLTTEDSKYILTRFPIIDNKSSGVIIKTCGGNIFIPNFLKDELRVVITPNEYIQRIVNLVTNPIHGDFWVACTLIGNGLKNNTRKIKVEVQRLTDIDINSQDKQSIIRTLTVPEYLLRKTDNKLEVKSWCVRKKLKSNETLPRGYWNGEESFRQFIHNCFIELHKRLKQDVLKVEDLCQ